jgi:CBS domain-containing protein
VAALADGGGGTVYLPPSVALQSLLKRTTIADIAKPGQQVVLLEHNKTVGEALKTLSQHKILSAPMVSRQHGEYRSKAAAVPFLRSLLHHLLLQVISPDIEEVQGGEMSPQLLGWIDVADVLRAFLQRELPAVWCGAPPSMSLACTAADADQQFTILLSMLPFFAADLNDAGHQLPTQMLALMNLLEKEGPVFSDRLLVTIRGVVRCGVVCCAVVLEDFLSAI